MNIFSLKNFALYYILKITKLQVLHQCLLRFVEMALIYKIKEIIFIISLPLNYLAPSLNNTALIVKNIHFISSHKLQFLQ